MSPLASDCQSEPVGLIVIINRTRRKLSMRQMRALDETRKFDDLKKSLPPVLYPLCIKGFQAKTGVREGKIYTPNVIKYTILSKICTFASLLGKPPQATEFTA